MWRILIQILIIICFVFAYVKQCSRIETLDTKYRALHANQCQISHILDTAAENQQSFAQKTGYMIDMYDSVRDMRNEMLRMHEAILESQLLMCIDTSKRNDP